MSHPQFRARILAALASLALVLAACGPDSSDTAAPPDIVTLPPVLSVSQSAPEPIRASLIAMGTHDESVDVKVASGTDGVAVSVREIIIQPGVSTGRHCHHGQLISVIRRGELTHYADLHPGGERVYRAGESFIDGAGYVHEVRNTGTEDVVLTVTYMTPSGKPPTEMNLAECER